MKKDIQEGFVQVPGGIIWYKITGANAGRDEKDNP